MKTTIAQCGDLIVNDISVLVEEECRMVSSSSAKDNMSGIILDPLKLYSHWEIKC